jgi:SAM-dependent methyltransferase
MTRPRTLENRWDILYREYPEVYEEFGSFPYEPDPIDVLIDRLEPRDLDTVVDLGSGTGRSTLRIARRARRVIGIEPEVAMRRVAERLAHERGVTNVSYVAATKEHVPLPDSSADAVVAIFGGMDVPEAMRVVRPGGLLASVDVAPEHYGGDLGGIIGEATPELERVSRAFVEEHGFAFHDFESLQDFGSTDAIVRTYGFIFGTRAIEHLLATEQTTIRWRFRLHHRRA